jgi:pimeloyl-ACP methyl ester carboxylesterase
MTYRLGRTNSPDNVWRNVRAHKRPNEFAADRPAARRGDNIADVGAEYHTFAVDQIGDFGRSVCTRPVQRLSDLLAWLNELSDGLGLSGGVNPVGISSGAALAAQCARHFPERLNKPFSSRPGLLFCG